MPKEKDGGTDPVKSTSVSNKQKDRGKVSGRDASSRSDSEGAYKDSDAKFEGKMKKKGK